MEFPAKVVLRSGAVVLLANTSQMEALPIGAAFEWDGLTVDGTHLYTEGPLSMAAEAKALRSGLEAAQRDLVWAAQMIRDGGGSPLKARQCHEAAERAKLVLEDNVLA